MNPTWESDCGTVKLWLGDCLEVMASWPNGAVDAVVTDPPYSSGGFTQAAISKAKGQGLRSETINRDGWWQGDAMTATGGAFLMRELAVSANRATTDVATLTTFTDWRMSSLYGPAIESARWRWQNLLVWDKGNAGLGSGFRAQHELALHFSKGSPPYFCSRWGNVLSSSRVASSEKDHPCEKPAELIEKIIETVSNTSHVIADPFMGSGTTGVAAVRRGRKFWGIEIDPQYFETAKRRIQDELAKVAFLEPQPTTKQQELFA